MSINKKAAPVQDWDEVEALRESLREHMAEIHRLRAALADHSGDANEIDQEIEAAMADQVTHGMGIMLDGKRIDPASIYKQAESATCQESRQVEPVAWAGYDLDAMVEAFSRVIEDHHSSKHPFHNPINMDAQTALRILRRFIPAMKASALSKAEPVQEQEPDDEPTYCPTCGVEDGGTTCGMPNCGLRCGAEQAEPVAWMDIDSEGNRLSVRQWSDGNSQEVPLFERAHGIGDA